MLKRIKKFLENHSLYWQIIEELSSYSDYELADIGINRVDIKAIAREAIS